MDDLWPNTFEETTEFFSRPIQILKEQASLLGRKTEGLVEGRIEFVGNSPSPNSLWIYKFVLVAPQLNEYVYELFVVAHHSADYPVYIQLDETLGIHLPPITSSMSAKIPKGRKVMGKKLIQSIFSTKDPITSATTEEEYIEFLRTIFNAPKTRQIIGFLISESKITVNEP